MGSLDPIGSTADDDEPAPKCRPGAEPTHGPNATLAIMRCIMFGITGKFPGYLALSTALKFAEVPTDPATTAGMPAPGWFQRVFPSGYIKLSAMAPNRSESPGRSPRASSSS